MDDNTRRFILNLPGEDVVFDVPRIEPLGQERPRLTQLDVAKGYPHAITYDVSGEGIRQE